MLLPIPALLSGFQFIFYGVEHSGRHESFKGVESDKLASGSARCLHPDTAVDGRFRESSACH